VLLPNTNAGLNVLGTADNFAVLAGSTVTNTGTTNVFGNLGVDPGLAVTGFPPGLVSGGIIHAGDAVALQAQNDATAASIALAGEAFTVDLTGMDLGGMKLTTGVYHFSSSAQLTGTLTLDASGDPSALFVFQIGSTLTTASSSSVLVVNGAEDCNIFWQVGSSATLGTTTAFKGNIIALTSITLDTNATVSGRALARNAAVTMDSNQVSTEACSQVSQEDAGVDVDASASDGSGNDGASLCCGGVLCGSVCRDLNSDQANCGSCGNACGADQACTGGSCVTCTTVCGGKCADLAHDYYNCGSCGNACLNGNVCSSGTCVTCPTTVCAGSCVDLTADNVNCGSCGNACLASAKCTAGSCVTCTSLCSGVCTDLQNDPANCGTCSSACPSGDSCNSGSCVCM
jgi:hypothetical protein